MKETVKAVNQHPSLKMDSAKRAQLFDVAIREFVTHGFAQASLNRIISEVKMSKSSFYHYFANKTELFQQIMDQSLEPISAMVLDFDLEELTAESFWPTLLGAGQNAAGMFVDNPQIILLGRMFYKSRETISEQDISSGFLTTGKALMIALLKRGQELKVIRDDLPDDLLLQAVVGLGMSLDQWFLENFHVIPKEIFDEMNGKSMDMIIRLLSPASKKFPNFV